MQVHRVFRQIQRKNTFLGLELTDIFLLLVALGTMLMFTDQIALVVGLGALIYGAIFVLKRGKPGKYTIHLFRFHTSKRRYSPQANEHRTQNQTANHD